MPPVPATPAVPSPARQLVVVARGETGLHRYLSTALARDPHTVVLVDRRATAAGAPPHGSERRKPVTFRRDLSVHLVIVVREERTSTPRKRGPMNNGEVEIGSDRERVERWVEDSQYVIGRLIPGLLEDRDRWRTKTEAAEQEIDRLRAEIGAMRREITEREAEKQYVRAEQAAMADAFNKAMDHIAQMQQPLHEVLSRLQSLQPGLVEANGR
ncbi:MAG: hypothetical protein HYR51_06090 [Candidatus Rokubacteria bacterium]|nr:hypothetical protein [Candidatus Rokubacteria bacterium]